MHQIDLTRRALGALMGVSICLGACESSERPIATSGSGTILEGSPRLSTHEPLQSTWEVPGTWQAIDLDREDNEVVGLRDLEMAGGGARWSAQICRVNVNGDATFVRTISGSQLPPRNVLLTVNRKKGGHAFLVADKTWHGGNRLSVYDLYGAQVSTHSLPLTLQAVAVSDLNGDGTDDIIAGGAGDGILAMRLDGSRLWLAPTRENIWDIAAMPRSPIEAPQVVVSGDLGVRVIDADGRVKSKVHTAFTYWRLAVSATEDRAPLIVGTSENPLKLEAVALDGTRSWCITDNSLRDTYQVDIAVTEDQSRIAVSMKDGRVVIYDGSDGHRLAWLAAGAWPVLTWFPSDDSGKHLLVVASGSGLAAYGI